jgi:hypothetical protein
MSYKNAVPQKQADGTFLLRYQVVDAENNPIGQPSVFTGATESECYQKSVIAHQQATAAIERLRKRTPVYKPGAQPTLDQATQQAVEAERAMSEAKESYEFMSRHADPNSPDYFFPCSANAAIMKSELEAEDLPWLAENLEIIFDRIRDTGKLAKRVPIQTPQTSEEIIPPAKTPWSHITTREDIDRMPREKYRELMFSPKYGNDFKKHVATILGGN